MNYFLISNMYPTEKYPGYGCFVKNVSDKLSEIGMEEYCRSVIYGRANTIIHKIVKYVVFYISILFNYWRKYDFIYIHFPNQATLILLPLLVFHRRKLVVNFHGEDLVYSNKGYTKLLGKLTEKMCRKYANVIVVPSEYFKNIVQDKRLIDADKIVISASGGIDSKVFFHKPTCPNKNLHIGYVGRLEEEKGISVFLNVCNLLHEEHIEFKATIIGYGSYLERAKEFINKNNLSSSVSLIGGIEQSKLGDYYRTFDLLIFCSKAKTGESLGLTGIEAMACGTPVIGSNIGGIATYLKDGLNGWLTPINDTEAIIERIKSFIALSKEEKKRMSEYSFLTGEKYYSEIVVEDLKEQLLILLTNQ